VKHPVCTYIAHVGLHRPAWPRTSLGGNKACENINNRFSHQGSICRSGYEKIAIFDSIANNDTRFRYIVERHWELVCDLLH